MFVVRAVDRARSAARALLFPKPDWQIGVQLVKICQDEPTKARRREYGRGAFPVRSNRGRPNELAAAQSQFRQSTGPSATSNSAPNDDRSSVEANTGG